MGFGKGGKKRKKRKKRRRKRKKIIIRGSRRGFKMPRGRWMLRIVRKGTRKRMRVFVTGARKGSGLFKGKAGKRRKIISRRKWRIRIQGWVRRRRRRRRRRWVNAGHKMKITGRRRIIYGEISGRGKFNDLIIKLVRL